MPWPTSQEYNEAIQCPQDTFADPELRAGQAVTNALGIPMPCSGNFADVYQFQCPATGKTWAIKCFTRYVPNLRERYLKISQHLEQARLPFMVDFTFLQQGIKIGTDWYPILKMQWVEGLTLNQFLREYLDKPPVLESLCQVWLKLARRMREANLAHCDLQHGNVLLVPGIKGGSLSVRLVDYDGMWVPALESVKSNEVGHPAYQHPQRLHLGIYNLDVDRFPNLLIYTVLRALLAGGRDLWDRFDNGDNLLFTAKDFEDPNQSPVFQELRKIDNVEVQGLVQVLAVAARRPLAMVPLLDDLPAPAPRPPKPVPRPARPAVPIAAPASDTEYADDADERAPALLVDPPRRRRRGNGRKVIVGLAVAAALAVVLGIAGVVVYNATMGADRFARHSGAPHDSSSGTSGISTPGVSTPSSGSRSSKLSSSVPVDGSASSSKPASPSEPSSSAATPKGSSPGSAGSGSGPGSSSGSDTVVSSPDDARKATYDNLIAEVRFAVTDQRYDDALLAANAALALFPGDENASRLVRHVARARTDSVAKGSGSSPKVRDGPQGMKFVTVSPGTFWMSKDGKNAQREETIKEDFCMAVCPVTQEQWQTVMKVNPSSFRHFGKHARKIKEIKDADLKLFPVDSVSWDDVQEFLRKLNDQEKGSGWKYRLPTEAEWEYACRGAVTAKDKCDFDFYFDQPTNDLESTQANFDGSYPAGKGATGPFLERPSKVGSYAPNRLGLYDMHGNVRHWCDDSVGTELRIIRGGGWDAPAANCRAAVRATARVDLRLDNVGFRLVRVSDDAK